MSIYSKIREYFKPPQLTIEDSFTWKYIDVDTKLVEEIKDIYLLNLKKDLSRYAFFQTLPIVVPDVMGYSTIGAGLVYTAGKHKVRYSHKDPLLDGASTFALNIPLLNCENSVTTLYTNRRAPFYSLYGNESRLAEVTKITECDVITSYTLDRPILFNTQVFHSVENFSPEPRLAISLRFTKNPVEWIQ